MAQLLMAGAYANLEEFPQMIPAAEQHLCFDALHTADEGRFTVFAECLGDLAT